MSNKFKFILIVFCVCYCSTASYARRVFDVGLEQVLIEYFYLDSEAAEESISQSKDYMEPYISKFKAIGSILQQSSNNNSMHLSSIARDLIALADSLKEIDNRFSSLIDMVLNVAEVKRDAKFLFQLMRSLDVAINYENWSHFEGLKKHFSFSMDKIAQLAANSDLKGNEILSQLQFFFHQAGGSKLECDRLVKEFILKNSGCCFNLSRFGDNLGVVSFDWGGTLSLIMSDIEIRDNVRSLLLELREKGVEVWIITGANTGEVSSRLRELDNVEDGSFSWSDCFRDKVVQALPAELSPSYTKGAYLQNITQSVPGKIVVHFDDNPKYSNLGLLSSNLISIGVIAADITDTDFSSRVEALSQSDGMVINLGFDYSKMFQLWGE